VLTKNSVLNDLLVAKEQLVEQKLLCARENHKPIVSLTLNIPGWPKDLAGADAFFHKMLSGFYVFAKAQRIFMDECQLRTGKSAVGNYFYAPVDFAESIENLKRITEQFEHQHALGRFIDVDVMSANGDYISSGKQKQCFICDEPANDCRRLQQHSVEQLRGFMQNKMLDWLKMQQKITRAKLLSEYTLFALLAEASLFPKPGLVSPVDCGAHTDMDYNTFLVSISRLMPELSAFYTSALSRGEPFSVAQLRELGVRAENAMFEGTQKINTHKGAIFLFLLAGSAITNLLRQNLSLSDENIRNELFKIADYFTNDPAIAKDVTNGNAVLRNFPMQKAGIRNEAASALPTVFKYGLPELRKSGYHQNLPVGKRNRALFRTLLTIMQVNSDSNVIHRGGIGKLETVQQKAAYSYNALINNQMSPYEAFCTWCKNENISPGGSADLLSVSIFIYLCQQNTNFSVYEL
jgi:holo-ACP synthase/triphosphoribosyl-dephospho-CoA synthase